ncbi:MAG: CHASE4 domain-containing protein [Methanomassiliicoccus sp.]|nr:CHASE4 domain-containing protein [Methanomassiliicoccus sp.]
MKLLQKTIAVIVISVIVMILLDVVALNYFIGEDVRKTETREASNLLNRVNTAMVSEVNSLGVDCFNWAAWNDTYAFVQDPNQGYIDANFNAAGLATINHTIVLIINETGTDVLHIHYDTNNRTQDQFPSGDLTFLMNDGVLQDHTISRKITGIINLPSGPYLISSCAIVNSDATGPVMGSIIFGNRIDAAMLGKISSASGAPVSIISINGSIGTTEQAAARDHLMRSSSVYIADVNSSIALCYGSMNDVHGQTGILISAELPRDAYAQGMSALTMASEATIAFGFVVVVIALISMNKAVVSRIIGLGDDVRRIGNGNSSTQSISVQGDDEIHSLSEEINGMLRSIEKRTKDLMESEGRYKSVMEQSVGAIIIIDPETNSLIEANNAFFKLFGYNKEDIPKLTLDLINPANRSKMAAILQCINENGSVVGAELSLQHQNGNTIDVELYGSYIEYKGKKVYCITGWDVTERNQVEAAKDRMEKLESVGKLAGGIAHDFNNLLTGIMGNISLLKEQLGSVSRACDRLEDTEIAALRAREIAQELLSLSRGGEPIKQPVNVQEILRTCAHFSFQGTKVKYEFHFPDDLSSINADPGQISRVFFNLFINAKDAMPDGGSVEVSATNFILDHSGINSLSPGKYVSITVKDSGPGIPIDVLPKIFEPYFTTKKTGAGMGLYVVFATIKRHGGAIVVESTVGKGTAFHVYLPASGTIPAKAPERLPVPKSIHSQNGARVLIMDDQDAILDVTSDILHELGYEVGMARDGNEALQQYRKSMDEGRKYDLVIMDLTIPQGMGGKEAVKRLLEIDPKAKAVVSSGYSEDPIMANYKAYGFVGVLPKPFQMNDLANEVQKACQYRQAGEDGAEQSAI